MKMLLELARGIWCIEHGYADAHKAQAMAILNTAVQRHDENAKHLPQHAPGVRFAFLGASSEGETFHLSDYGQTFAPEDAPPGSIAVLEIAQVITKYDQDCGPSGMLTKGDLLQRLAINENVEGIIIRQDSGGGEGNAARYMANIIRDVTAIKPVMSYISDFSASASYYIGAPATISIANSPTALVGSIGTYYTIADQREFFKMNGVNFIEVYADESKDKNKEYYDLLEGDDTGYKRLLNHFNDTFISDVTSMRGDRLTADRKVWGTGKLFFAEEAKSLGLIDDIMPWESAVQLMFQIIQDKNG